MSILRNPIFFTIRSAMGAAIIRIMNFFFLCFIIVIILLPFLSFGASSSPGGFMESAREALMASLHRQGGKPSQVQRISPGGPDQQHH
ncbi:unnamed protein product [Citrullus colocynthis]|uniref:CLAVATA3/ESR (CLE)-related protein n=1 Tax=Citrullus colocynthis TaxID=252529 RepID=A0ABP0YZA1_9ROSI